MGGEERGERRAGRAGAPGGGRWRGRAGRLADAASPALAGLLVDATDLATFGPLGLAIGGLAGALVGWQVAPRLGLAERRWLPSLLAGVYCMAPGTSFVPLATLLAVAGSLLGAIPKDAAPARGDAIEAEFRVREEPGERAPD
ncbi:MAG: hypothetical protein KC560_10985 [Myxococcales bacterium]|nr:hypothetical protein [Myxococcales bacterium]